MMNRSKIHKVASLIRIIAVPPVMAVILITLLALTSQDVFQSSFDMFISIVFLAVLPAAAYPVSYIVPKIKALGRSGQRNLAFWFSGAGYLAAICYGLFFHKSKGLLFIYLTYLFSILFLAFVNKVLKKKASGHACSIIWPIIVACYYYTFIGAIIGGAFYATVCWSSVKLKRHTLGEFLLGTTICLLAAAVSAMIIFVGLK